MANYKYVCVNNPEHLFEEATPDFWCPICDISTHPLLISYQATPPPSPQPEPAKPEPPKQEPIKPEPPKQEPIKPEPPKQEPIKPEPPKQEPIKPEPPKIDKPQLVEIPRVRFGTQIWMKHYLNIFDLASDAEIVHAKDEKEWKLAKQNRVAAWCHPNNDPALGKKMGLLYNFYAVSVIEQYLPEGWSIPNKEEALELIDAYSDDFLEHDLKVSMDKNVAYRLSMGTFIDNPNKRQFWTCSSNIIHTAFAFDAHTKSGVKHLQLFDKNCGFFIRCIKKNDNKKK